MSLDTPLPVTAPAEPLRILQVLEPSGGGSGRHFLDLCRGLKQRGHHVEAIHSPVRAEESFVRELKSLGLAGVHRVSMRRAPGKSDIAAFRAIAKVVRKRGPFDIIHGHSSKAGALTRLRLPGRHMPRVYTPHAFRTMDPTLGRMGRLVYGVIETVLARFFTDLLICVSNDEYKHALSLGMPAKKLAVIVNGVNAPKPDMAATVRASFGIAADTFLFGFIGRLSHQKAPELLVEAFRQAASTLRDAHLIMVGAGELEPEIKTAIAESGLQNRIHLTSAFTGPQAVSCFNALVMPSRYEAMSYVMLEAAAAGKPIISTDIGGAATVIEQDGNGLIVPNNGDASALAGAMIETASPDRYAALKASAESRKNRYSLDIMVERTEAEYRKLL